MYAAKSETCNSFPLPQNSTDVRSFLGLTSCYQRSISGLESRSKPLADFKRSAGLLWTKGAQESFDDLLKCLATCPIVKCPDFCLSFNLYNVACDYGIGAVRTPEIPGGEVVIAYASRLLKP